MRDKVKRAASARAYQAAHREEISAGGRAYRAAHREEISAYHRAHYAAHREEISAQGRAYQAAHREEIRAYRAAHREEISVRERAYRAAHREEISVRERAYRAAHREEIIASYKAGRETLSSVYVRKLVRQNAKTHGLPIPTALENVCRKLLTLKRKLEKCPSPKPNLNRPTAETSSMTWSNCSLMPSASFLTRTPETKGAT